MAAQWLDPTAHHNYTRIGISAFKIAASSGEWGQIAVGGVHLQAVEPGGEGVPRRSGVLLDDDGISAVLNVRGVGIGAGLSIGPDVRGRNGRCATRLERRMRDAPELDMDSSESPTYGEQEGSAYNGHFSCTCYHPLSCSTSLAMWSGALCARGTCTAPMVGVGC